MGEEFDGLGIVLAERRADNRDEGAVEERADRRAQQERRQANLRRAHDERPIRAHHRRLARDEDAEDTPVAQPEFDVVGARLRQPDVAPDPRDRLRAQPIANQIGRRRKDQAAERRRQDGKNQAHVRLRLHG